MGCFAIYLVGYASTCDKMQLNDRLHLGEHYNFCSSTNIIRLIKSGTQFTELVSVRNTNALGGLSEGNRPFGRNVRTLGDNKMDFE